jgi:peptide-methionine (R)-S-oxide reductase
MKKRYFLQAGAAIVGTAWLSRYLTGRSGDMATSNGEFEINKTEEEWRKILTPEQFSVLRKHGTERAHTSSLDSLVRIS